MTYKTLIIAGWFSMTSAFFSIPLTYFSYLLDGRGDTVSIAARIAIQTGGVLLYVAITLYLKKLLNVLFKFHETDRIMVLMIVANVVSSVIAAVAGFTRFEEQLAIAALAILALQGVAQIWFGYRLRKLPYELDGMLKPFSFLNMATGLCVASVVLLVVGVVASAITDLMLGTIFFHIARLVREAHSVKSET